MQTFVKKFKELIEKYKDIIIDGRPDSIKECERIRDNNGEILKRLLIVKVSKGFWRPAPIIDGIKFSESIDDLNWTPEFFLTENGKQIMIKYLKYFKKANGHYNNLCEYLFKRINNNNMKNWIEKAIDKKIVREKVLGKKGIKSWNIFLRDAFDYKYIPIDIHERRFLIRTGIFNHYLGIDINDPQDNSHFELALQRFSRDFLSGTKIREYDLGENPGLVDKFIWFHCAEDPNIEITIRAKGICSKVPKCKICDLREGCSLYINITE